MGAAALPYVALAFTAAGTMMQMKASKDQKDIANRQAAAALAAGERAAADRRAETAEKLRKEKQQQEYELGLAKARAGASGVAGTGTVAGYLAELKRRGGADLDWIKKSGEAAAQAALESGGQASYVAETAGSQAMAGFWGGASDLASVGYSAYKQYSSTGG